LIKLNSIDDIHNLSIYKCDHLCVFKEGHLPLLPPATAALPMEMPIKIEFERHPTEKLPRESESEAEAEAEA
jgi:hypothetical protein